MLACSLAASHTCLLFDSIFLSKSYKTPFWAYIKAVITKHETTKSHLLFIFASFYIAQQKSKSLLIPKIIILMHLQGARSGTTCCPWPQFFSLIWRTEKPSGMRGIHSDIWHGNLPFSNILGTGPSSQKKGKGGITSVHCNPHNRGAMLVF